MRILERFSPGADIMTSKKECGCESYIKKSVTLPDGFTYYYFQCPKCSRVEYPLRQAQALIDYSKDHIFMFVEDWILAWMATSDTNEYAPIPGITMIQKQMVIIIREFAPEHDIPSENPGFKAYKFGPYTERIDRALDVLYKSGYVNSKGRINSNNERFYLTEEGVAKGKAILSKFDQGIIDDLLALKHDLQQLTLQGIETYVYSKYPEYTDKSEIFERVLHRKR